MLGSSRLPQKRSTAITPTTIPGRLVPIEIQRMAFCSNASKRWQSSVSFAFMPFLPSSPRTTISNAKQPTIEGSETLSHFVPVKLAALGDFLHLL
jgi:hypothetical protein